MGYASIEDVNAIEDTKQEIETSMKEANQVYDDLTQKPSQYDTEIQLAIQAMNETATNVISSLNESDSPADWYNTFKEHEETYDSTLSLIESYRGDIEDERLNDDLTQVNNIYNGTLGQFMKIYTEYYFTLINGYEDLYMEFRQQYVDNNISKDNFTEEKDKIVNELTELEKDEYVKSEAETVKKSIVSDYNDVIGNDTGNWWSSLDDTYKYMIYGAMFIVIIFVVMRIN